MRKSFFVAILVLLILSEGTFAQAQTKAPSDKTIGYQLRRLRKTKLYFPYLTKYHDAKIRRAVNRNIDIHTADFGCENAKNGTYKLRSKVTFARRAIFSVYASAEYYCGGAYPTNDANQSITFDLKTGKQVGFQELFKHYEANKQAILKLIFAKQIQRSAKIAARLKASGKTPEPSCDSDPSLYSLEHLMTTTFHFDFSAVGLQVQPDWPHAIEGCSMVVTVPYAKLKTYATSESILARVIK